MEKLPISNTRSASLFAMDGIPHFFEALPLALQHVVAMIVGCVTPAIIVAGAAGLSQPDSPSPTESYSFRPPLSQLPSARFFSSIPWENARDFTSAPAFRSSSASALPTFRPCSLSPVNTESPPS